MRKVRYIKDLRRLLAAALYDGAERVSDTTFRWNASGKCLDPVHFTLEGRAPEWMHIDAWGDGVPLGIGSQAYPSREGFRDSMLFIDMTAKCRRCTWCLKRCASEWSIRARHEIRASTRTWFGTLTLTPQAHFEASCRAHTSPPVEAWSFQVQLGA